MSNSHPYVIGRLYEEHLYETRMIASKLRIDRGTMATIHAFLRQNHADMNGRDTSDVCKNTVIFGPSTSNQAS